MSSSDLDISQLNEAQQSALQVFTSVTDQDPLAAIPLLQRSEWNVQIAIARFFDGEPTTDPVAEARNSLPSTSARQTTNLRYEALLAAPRATSSTRVEGDPVNRVNAAPSGELHYRPPFLLSILLTPLNILYRIFSTLLSPLSFLVPAVVPRLLARLTSAYLSRPSRRPLPPADTARRFIRAFTEEYGQNNLPFAENGFNLSLENAKRDLSFLVVILLSPNHEDTASWVRESLLSTQFNQFLEAHRDNLRLWGGNVQDAEAYQVATSLGCTKFPFAALICHTPGVGPTGMSVVARAVGPMPASELVAKLGSAITVNEGVLSAERSQRREQQASRNLRQEQDSAYERSLTQDRERAQRKREEQEARARAEREAHLKAQAEEKRKRDLGQWRRWRARSLPPEPDSSSKDAIRISIRLPSGERVIRRFLADADLEELYAFVECFEILSARETPEKEVQEPDGFDHIYEFRLVSPMPRTVYELEMGGSIGERIGKGANLIVELIEPDDESGG